MQHVRAKRPTKARAKRPTKAQVETWKARWRLLDAMRVEDAKRLTPDDKLEAILQLMHVALSVPETEHRRRRVRAVAEQWARFRRVYGDCRAGRST